MSKLGVRDRTRAVLKALELGYLEADDPVFPARAELRDRAARDTQLIEAWVQHAHTLRQLVAALHRQLRLRPRIHKINRWAVKS